MDELNDIGMLMAAFFIIAVVLIGGELYLVTQPDHPLGGTNLSLLFGP